MQPSECGTLSFDADGFRFKTTNGPQLIAFVFVFETTPASEGGRYMACIRTKGIEALILIPAERKRILTEALQYEFAATRDPDRQIQMESRIECRYNGLNEILASGS